MAFVWTSFYSFVQFPSRYRTPASGSVLEQVLSLQYSMVTPLLDPYLQSEEPGSEGSSAKDKSWPGSLGLLLLSQALLPPHNRRILAGKVMRKKRRQKDFAPNLSQHEFFSTTEVFVCLIPVPSSSQARWGNLLRTNGTHPQGTHHCTRKSFQQIYGGSLKN